MINVTELDQIKHKGKTFEIKTIEDIRDDGINIGDYRDRVTIQCKILVPDGEGGFTEGWVDVITVWAKVTSIQARQRYTFNSIGVEATHRIEIRGKKIITCREIR